jgi:hypothetical protein
LPTNHPAVVKPIATSKAAPSEKPFFMPDLP